MKFGAHISSASPFGQTIGRAQEAKCDCIQIFANQPQRWNPTKIPKTEIEEFVQANQQARIEPIVIHSIYLINLASTNPYFYTASQQSLIDDLGKGRKIGALGVNTHLGSFKDRDEEDAFVAVAAAIKNILKSTPDGPDLIIENSAGAGKIIGDTLEEIGRVIKTVDSRRVRVLIDTAHAFESGYHIETKEGLEEMLHLFEREIGLDRLVGLHLNDSATAFNSKRDRHANIGEGEIGLEAFKRIVNHPKLKDLFGIIETPSLKGKGGIDNLEILRGLQSS